MAEKHLTEESIPFYPDHISTEAKVTLGVLALVVVFGVIGLFNPVGLGEPADPLNTPTHIKPEWYFLGLYQVLKFESVSKTTGALIPVLAVLLLLVWPFIDRKPDRSPRIYRTRFIIVAVISVILIALTIWGEVS